MRTSLLDLLKESTELGELSEGAKHPDLVDEVGKFFVVEKPSKDSTKDDILFQSDIFYFANQIKGGLKTITRDWPVLVLEVFFEKETIKFVTEELGYTIKAVCPRGWDHVLVKEHNV